MNGLKEFTAKILSVHLYYRYSVYVDRFNRFIIFIDSVSPVTSILYELERPSWL